MLTDNILGDFQPHPGVKSPGCFSDSAPNFSVWNAFAQKEHRQLGLPTHCRCFTDHLYCGCITDHVPWSHPVSLGHQVAALWMFSIQPFMKLQGAEMPPVLFQSSWDGMMPLQFRNGSWVMLAMQSEKVTSVCAPRRKATLKIFSLGKSLVPCWHTCHSGYNGHFELMSKSYRIIQLCLI